MHCIDILDIKKRNNKNIKRTYRGISNPLKARSKERKEDKTTDKQRDDKS